MIKLELKKIADSARDSILNHSVEHQLICAEEFSEFLLLNGSSADFKSLNVQEQIDFEICCLIFEFHFLHLEKQLDMCFLIKSISFLYPSMELLNKRISCLRLPDEISNIENEWKQNLRQFLSSVQKLKDLSSKSLTESGMEVYIERVGYRVVSRISFLLQRINLGSELAMNIVNLCEQVGGDEKFLAQALKWTINRDEVALSEDLINVQISAVGQ